MDQLQGCYWLFLQTDMLRAQDATYRLLLNLDSVPASLSGAEGRFASTLPSHPLMESGTMQVTVTAYE